MDPSLFSIFAAGLLTLVTPCILPMLPVYLSLLLGASVDQARTPAARFHLVSASAVFVAGFSLVFTLLGFGASAAGAALQTHRDLLLIVGGVVIFLFGLKYLGVLRFHLLDRTVQVQQLQTGSRLLNAFAFGVVFALGWTPCVGPILGSVLTYTAATTSSPLLGGAYLLTYSLGVGLPLLALSLFADRAIPHVRKLNRFLPKVEKATGVLMVAVGLVLAFPGIAGYLAPTSKVVSSLQDDEQGLLDGGTPLSPALGSPAEKPRIVEFYAEHCPVCDRMRPRVEQLESDCVHQRVEVLTVNVSDPRNAALVRQFAVHAVPTFKLFDREGNVKGQLFGEQDLDVLRGAAAGLLEETCAGVEGREEPENVLGNPSCATVAFTGDNSAEEQGGVECSVSQ